MGDLPLNLDVPAATEPPLPRPPDSSILSRLAPESSAIGSYDPDPEHNGGSRFKASIGRASSWKTHAAKARR
jgi:hypothetical protein